MRRLLVRLVAVAVVAGLLVLVRPVPVGATASAVDRYRDVVLEDGPVAFWQMQEPSSAPSPVEAVDVAGGHDGHAFAGADGGVSYGSAEGPFVSSFAYRVTANCGGVAVDDPGTTFQNSAYTFEIWFKIGTNQSGGTIFKSRSSDAPGAGLTVSKTEIVSYATTSAGLGSATETVTLDDGSWHHVAAARSGAGAHIIWLDGVRVEEASGPSASITYGTGDPRLIISSDGPWIGCIAWSFNGSFTEAAYYDEVLTDRQVRDHACFDKPFTHHLYPASKCSRPSVVTDPDSGALHGDPVDVYTGSLVAEAVDLEAPGRSPGASLSRTYISGMASSGVFGPRWRSSIETSLVLTSAQDVELTEASGLVRVFEGPSTSSWVAPGSYPGAELTRSGGTYTLKRPGGQVDTFDSAGRLTSRASATGTTVEVSWAPTAGTVAVIEGPGGYSVTLADSVTWASGSPASGTDGLVDRATSSDGRTVTYTYDLDGVIPVLAAASRPHRVDAESVTPRPFGLTRYESVRTLVRAIYEELEPGRERLVTAVTYGDEDRVVAQRTADGDLVEFHYGKKPASFSSGYNGALTADGSFTTVDNTASGDRTVYQFDGFGRVVGTYDALGHAVVRSWVDATNASALVGATTSRTDIVTTSAYDAYRLASQVRQVGSSGTPVPVTSIEYVTPGSTAGAVFDPRVASMSDAAGWRRSSTTTARRRCLTRSRPRVSPGRCRRGCRVRAAARSPRSWSTARGRRLIW